MKRYCMGRTYFPFVFISVMTLILWTKSVKGQNPTPINPTGIYTYSGKTYIKNGDTYGYFGTIKVLKLDSNRVLINFFICKGAPNYNSGSFIDSLPYKGNVALYRGDTSDPQTTCKLSFTFMSQGVRVQLLSEYDGTCGFGNGVVGSGDFKKEKGRIPTKKEMLIHPLTGD